MLTLPNGPYSNPWTLPTLHEIQAVRLKHYLPVITATPTGANTDRSLAEPDKPEKSDNTVCMRLRRPVIFPMFSGPELKIVNRFLNSFYRTADNPFEPLLQRAFPDTIHQKYRFRSRALRVQTKPLLRVELHKIGPRNSLLGLPALV